MLDRRFVLENADLVRIEPISGPGVCGAEYPLKVAAIGEASTSFGFADDMRPPASIGNQPRWPLSQQPSYSSPYPYSSAPPSDSVSRAPLPPPQAAAPMPLGPPGVTPAEDEDFDEPPARAPSYNMPRNSTAPMTQPDASPRLGPARGNSVAAFGPVAVKPAATLACPIVSVLDRWFADAVQPAAMRWFGARVVEIKQISAYSCRGMNGNSRAHISEHAFGNALDIAAFTLADGRRISVKDGWRGLPEEQGFLRDVQGAACRQFNTVLAPGSNVYHYDHIHVDLMRRASGRVICQPAAVSGEEIAARAAPRSTFASHDAGITGSLALGGRGSASRRKVSSAPADDDWIEDESRIRDRD